MGIEVLGTTLVMGIFPNVNPWLPLNCKGCSFLAFDLQTARELTHPQILAFCAPFWSCSCLFLNHQEDLHDVLHQKGLDDIRMDHYS